MERKESGFCSYRCFLESKKLRCEKKIVSEGNYLFTCGILKQFFSLFLVKSFGYDFVFNFRLVFGSGLKFSGNSYEFAANSEVSHVFG